MALRLLRNYFGFPSLFRVHPCSNSPYFSRIKNRDDPLGIINLLPDDILRIVSVLTREDLEVLAYLMKWDAPDSEKTRIRFAPVCRAGPRQRNKFRCGCANCYREYHFKCTESPNHRRICLAIQAYNNMLSDAEAAEEVRQAEEKARMEAKQAAEKAKKERKKAFWERRFGPKKKNQGPRRWNRLKIKGLAGRVCPSVMGFFKSVFSKLWRPKRGSRKRGESKLCNSRQEQKGQM